MRYVKREIGELLCRETKKHHKKEGVPKNIGTPSFMQYFFFIGWRMGNPSPRSRRYRPTALQYATAGCICRYGRCGWLILS